VDDLTPRQTRLIALTTVWDCRGHPDSLVEFIAVGLARAGLEPLAAFELGELIRCIGPCLRRQHDTVIPGTIGFGPGALDL